MAWVGIHFSGIRHDHEALDSRAAAVRTGRVRDHYERALAAARRARDNLRPTVAVGPATGSAGSSSASATSTRSTPRVRPPVLRRTARLQKPASRPSQRWRTSARPSKPTPASPVTNPTAAPSPPWPNTSTARSKRRLLSYGSNDNEGHSDWIELKDHTMKPALVSRRELLQLTGAAALGSVCAPRRLLGAEPAAGEFGYVVGEATGEKAGLAVLGDGGNAIDAVVAAVLTAAVAAPASAGIGGFGMSAVIAQDGGRRLVAIDGTSAAPAAMRADTFSPVPMASCPTASTRRTGYPARAGFPPVCPESSPACNLPWIAAARVASVNWCSPPSPWREMVFPGPPAWLLRCRTERPFSRRTPAREDCSSPTASPWLPVNCSETTNSPRCSPRSPRQTPSSRFIEDDIARMIAAGFQKNGGLVTAQDMAAYQAPTGRPADDDLERVRDPHSAADGGWPERVADAARCGR